jgi:hypothetical protein
MSIEFLRQVAATPLPKSFTHDKDIDAVKILRQAGLVIALVDEPPEGAAKVVAITERGTDELLRFHYRSQSKGEVRGQGSSWFELAAQQVRSLVRRTDASG